MVLEKEEPFSYTLLIYRFLIRYYIHEMSESITTGVTSVTYLIQRYGTLSNIPEQAWRDQFNDVYRLGLQEITRPEASMLCAIAFSWLKSHISMLHYSKSLNYQISEWNKHNRFQVTHMIQSPAGLQAFVKESIARRSLFFTEISFNSRYLINKVCFVCRMTALEDVMITCATNSSCNLMLVVPNFVYRPQNNPKYTKYITLDEFAEMTQQTMPQYATTELNLKTSEEVHEDMGYESDYQEQLDADEYLHSQTLHDEAFTSRSDDGEVVHRDQEEQNYVCVEKHDAGLPATEDSQMDVDETI